MTAMEGMLKCVSPHLISASIMQALPEVRFIIFEKRYIAFELIQSSSASLSFPRPLCSFIHATHVQKAHWFYTAKCDPRQHSTLPHHNNKILCGRVQGYCVVRLATAS